MDNKVSPGGGIAMTAHPFSSPLQATSVSHCRCRQCGGSGMLRLDDQRYRTCLDCLGQGQVVRALGVTPAAITTADILQRRAEVVISLSASSSAR